MADANKHIIYSLADIQRYVEGNMSAREMHELERAALEDPFLADALEGYSDADWQQTQVHLTQIETAIRQPQQQAKVVALSRGKQYQNWQMAAAFILFVCISTVTYFIFYKKSNDAALAKNESALMPVKDSMQANMQQAAPALADTIAANKKEAATNTQNNTVIASNKRKPASSAHLRAAKTPAPAPAMQDENNKEAVQASSAMGLRTPLNEIAGTVTDNHQHPIPNATIMVQDSMVAVTDKNGSFRIATADSNTTASITAFGYKPLQNQQLKNGFNNILLQEKPFLLSDVEVIHIGAANKKSPDTTAIMPQGGWQSFRQYVYTKLHKQYDSSYIKNAYMDKELELEFSINENGDPVDFKVLNTPDAQTADEAISAIKKGPKWVNSDKQNKMRITVRYK